MWIKVVEDGLCNNYESKSKWTSLSFISIGIITIIYTLFSSLTANMIVATALVIAGLFSLYYTSKENAKVTASWVKSLIYISGGVAIFFVSAEFLLHLFSLFFILFALNSLYFAYLTRQDATAFSWFFDAILSAFFAFYIFSNPEIHLSTAALFMSIHFISVGLVLLYSGRKIYIRP